MTTENLIERLECIACENNSACDTTAREKLQSYFDNLYALYPDQYSDGAFEHLSRSGLYILRHLYNSEIPSTEAYQLCQLNQLFDNLTFCCDLLCGEWGKRIVFSYDSCEKLVLCNPRRLSWAFLNIISNAIIHSDGKYISIRANSVGNRIVVLTENEGSFEAADFFAALHRSGSGLECADKIIRSLNGSLVMSSLDRSVKVAFSLEQAKKTDEIQYRIPSVEELLYDRLSPIYAALCEL